MNDAKGGSEKQDDPRRKLWTYVFLGLTIGGLCLLGRHKTKRETAITDLSPVNAHLDRIEKKVESVQSQLSRQEKTTWFYIWLSIGFAFIVASPSIGFGLYGIEEMKNLVPISFWVLLGGLMILWIAGLEHSQSYHKKAALAALITTSVGAVMLVAPLIFDKTAIIGWRTVMGIGLSGVILGLVLWGWVLSTVKSLKRNRA